MDYKSSKLPFFSENNFLFNYVDYKNNMELNRSLKHLLLAGVLAVGVSSPALALEKKLSEESVDLNAEFSISEIEEPRILLANHFGEGYNWHCRAESPSGWGVGFSPYRGTAKSIALNNCAANTPYGQVCYIVDCDRF